MTSRTPARGVIRIAAVIAASAALTSACTDDAGAMSPGEELTFEVMNVGIDGVAELRGPERLEALPEALATAPVDVLCLQGIGAPADRARLKAALARTFPTSLDLPTDDATKVDDPTDLSGLSPEAPPRPACDATGALAEVVGCLQRSGCIASPRGNVASTRCLEASVCMPDRLFASDPERRCRSCISGHARTGEPIEEIRERCAERPLPLSLRGEHGMLLLSKLPLSRPAIHVLPSVGTRRAVLGATATTPRGAEIDVFCTSLGPTASSALPSDPSTSEPYPGPYGSPTDGWLRENELQIDKLSTWVTSRRDGRPAVIMGNFGAGSEITRAGAGVVVPASGPLGAARLAELFALGVAEDHAPNCTVCPDNPLVPRGTAPSFQNRIYLAGLPRSAVVASVRSYLGLVVGPGDDGERLPISVQYGFRSRIVVGRR